MRPHETKSFYTIMATLLQRKWHSTEWVYQIEDKYTEYMKNSNKPYIPRAKMRYFYGSDHIQTELSVQVHQMAEKYVKRYSTSLDIC